MILFNESVACTSGAACGVTGLVAYQVSETIFPLFGFLETLHPAGGYRVGCWFYTCFDHCLGFQLTPES
jgi:hypothetical protein